MRGFSLLTIVILLTAMLVAAPKAEAKNPFAGKEKAPELKMSADAEELAEEKAEAAKEKAKEAKQMRERKMKEEKEKLKGLEKQKAKKAEQVQKELGKGSEKGQAMRQEKRKKWWKFGFGKDEEEEIPVVE